MTINVITTLNYRSNIFCDLLQCLGMFQPLLQLKIQDRSIALSYLLQSAFSLIRNADCFYFSEQADGCYKFSSFCNSIEKTMKIVCRDDFDRKDN